ncbi:MAG: hypothetical protein M0Z60_04890, partial [Nitrospiraceae bacterium]|nr:hypothetical protein [Nitrospiraceae bacterium]
VEREGIRRSLDTLESADYAIAVLDGSEPLHADDLEILEKIKSKAAIIAINKSDLPLQISTDEGFLQGRPYIRLSALRGEGIEELKSMIFRANLKGWEEEREGVVVTNIRHKQSLDLAAAALGRAAKILAENRPLEIFSIELRDAADSIGEITGAVTTDDILKRIFDDFCIGK